MYVVSSSFFLRNLRNLNFFTLDLGKSKKVVGKDELRPVDKFVINYKNIYNREIVKFGKIGDKVIFYEDVMLEQYNYIIFNNDDIYEITYTDEDLEDIYNYILETLRKVDEFESNQKENNDKNNEISKDKFSNESGYWVAKDDKNRDKKYIIDQTLSREEYRKKIESLFYNGNQNI